jgi:hypothetical protein
MEKCWSGNMVKFWFHDLQVLWVSETGGYECVRWIKSSVLVVWHVMVFHCTQAHGRGFDIRVQACSHIGFGDQTRMDSWRALIYLFRHLNLGISCCHEWKSVGNVIWLNMDSMIFCSCECLRLLHEWECWVGRGLPHMTVFLRARNGMVACDVRARRRVLTSVGVQAWCILHLNLEIVLPWMEKCWSGNMVKFWFHDLQVLWVSETGGYECVRWIKSSVGW